MGDLTKALETQLANIEKRSGKTLKQLAAIITSSGLKKHGELRDMLKRDLGLGHGDANTLVHYVLKAGEPTAAGAQGQSTDDIVSGLYSGAKAALRPIHEKLMAEIGVAATERLVELPPGGMCNYKVKLTSAAEVDAELIAWIKRAFDGAA